MKTDIPNGDHQNGGKRVHFQETHQETFTILKTWKSCPWSSEEVCVFDAEFSEDGEESLV